MGCGAICGDNNVVQVANKVNSAQHIMSILIPSLDKASVLATRKSIENFIELYKQNPQKFHLSPKPQLTAEQQIPEEILIKWKLVLYGLDRDQKKYSECLGLSEKLDSEPQQELNAQTSTAHTQETIIFHKCFVQIGLDLDRTIALPMGRKRDFQNVLKRIANFFPKMGYTQGLNFIIGYLIIIGYSQNDSFWIFVHIAINRRYLLLGLYQDDFPLSNTFIIIFKNILKRTHQQLYQQTFQVLQLDTSIWIFKWFTTCFIYSFPLELIKYAWDIMIQQGSLGLVTFALSLTIELKPFLMRHQDQADAIQFIQSLKTIQCMNHYINVERVVKGTFQIQILQSDFEGVQQFGGFYGAYLKQKSKELKKSQPQKGEVLPKYSQIKTKSQQMLDQWYQKLNEERWQFINANKTTNTFDLPLLIESNQKPIKRSESGNIEMLMTHNERMNSQESKIRKGSLDLNKNELQLHRIKMQNLFDKINEFDEQSKSQKSQQSKVSRQGKIPRQNGYLHQIKNIRKNPPQGGMFDQLDKLEKQFDVKSKKSVIINNYASPHPIPKSKQTQLMSQITMKITTSKVNKDTTFGLAGRISLKIQNFDASSVKSKNISSKSRVKVSHMEGELNLSKAVRSCACKTKTEQNKLSSCDKNSELASMKDQFSDKDSISNRNLSHQENSQDLKSVNGERIATHRDNVTTIDYMVNSHGPTVKQKPTIHFGQQLKSRNLEAEQQIVVWPIKNFKKVKKMKQAKVSNIEISKSQVPSDSANLHDGHEEESLESIHHYCIEKGINQSCLHNGNDCTGGICEIESIR